MDKIIILDNIEKSFKHKNVIPKISFSINEGSMTAIIGKSGKGKSTLLNMIGLIDTYDSGNLSIMNHTNLNINSKKALLLRRKEIGYLFQNFGLADDETVKWNLMLPLEHEKISKKEKLQKIMYYLKLFNLESHVNHKIFQLSGGEQQRIALARLMLQDSNLILADEPTASLDSENEHFIFEELRKLNEKGKTILVVTHNKSLLKYFDNVIDLDQVY